MNRQAMVRDEVPSDDEVLNVVRKHEGGIGPTELLTALLGTGHTRANAQRAIQRCLERRKIKFDLNLRIQHLSDQAQAA
jgi:hypothetical protein